METAVAQQFLGFFEQYFNLCKKENWPNDDISELEIENAFLVSQHIEKCLEGLQKKAIINDFLSAINDGMETFKYCLADPPKYVLKKVINSNTKIAVMDKAFKVFVKVFSALKLEQYLADIMLEAASYETLIRNINNEFSKDAILKFKSTLFLNEVNLSEKDSALNVVKSLYSDNLELIVVCSLSKSYKYHDAVNNIINAFINIMLSKDNTFKPFWKMIFNVNENYLIEMCVEHYDLFKIMVNALLDCGKLLQQNMSAEYFYIDFTYSELTIIVQKLCKNLYLKTEFFKLVVESNNDLKFWENMIL